MGGEVLGLCQVGSLDDPDSAVEGIGVLDGVWPRRFDPKGHDPVPVGPKLFIESVDSLHLIWAAGVGPVVDHKHHKAHRAILLPNGGFWPFFGPFKPQM